MPFKDKDTASHCLQTLKHSLVRSLECPTHASSHMSTTPNKQLRTDTMTCRTCFNKQNSMALSRYSVFLTFLHIFYNKLTTTTKRFPMIAFFNSLFILYFESKLQHCLICNVVNKNHFQRSMVQPLSNFNRKAEFHLQLIKY